MRFKNINIEERSKKYSDIQKESLSKISESLNKIGDFFDTIVEFEKFIVKEIRKELNDYFNIREDKENIIKSNSKEYYINDVFLPVVKKLEDKMTLAIENWNMEKSNFNLNNIQGFITILKNMYSGIEDLKGDKNIETFDAIQNLINTFGSFVVYKSVTTEDRAKRIENLFYLKEELDETEEKINNPSKSRERRKLTIDDL